MIFIDLSYDELSGEVRQIMKVLRGGEKDRHRFGAKNARQKGTPPLQSPFA
jgi:hypothetical protein